MRITFPKSKFTVDNTLISKVDINSIALSFCQLISLAGIFVGSDADEKIKIRAERTPRCRFSTVLELKLE